MWSGFGGCPPFADPANVYIKGPQNAGFVRFGSGNHPQINSPVLDAICRDQAVAKRHFKVDGLPRSANARDNLERLLGGGRIPPVADKIR